MDFSELDNLSEEEIKLLYQDVLDTGIDVRMAGCCCKDGSMKNVYTMNDCKRWCRDHGSSCENWSRRIGCYTSC